MTEWLNDGLKTKVRRIFGPRYKRPLTDEEVFQIADNLTAVMEAYLKMKWRQKYENEPKQQSA